jgi:hypothetical protein
MSPYQVPRIWRLLLNLWTLVTYIIRAPKNPPMVARRSRYAPPYPGSNFSIILPRGLITWDTFCSLDITMEHSQIGPKISTFLSMPATQIYPSVTNVPKLKTEVLHVMENTERSYDEFNITTRNIWSCFSRIQCRSNLPTNTKITIVPTRNLPTVLRVVL